MFNPINGSAHAFAPTWIRGAALACALVAAGPVQADPLTFDQALVQAVGDAPELRASALSVDAARSAAPAAGLLPDPRLSVALDSYPISGPLAGRPQDDNFTMLKFGVSQDVPSRARRRAERGIADAEIDVAVAEDRIALREVRVATGLAWIDLFYAARRIEALDDVLSSLQPLWDTAPTGVASGSERPANALGPVQLKAALDDRRSELIADRDKARAALARWTGDAEPVAFGPPPPTHLDSVALMAGLDRLPSLNAYQAFGRRADAQVDLARAGRQPDWSFELGYARRDPQFGDYVSVGASVRLPIFQDRRQEPLIAARAAQSRAVLAEREATERDLSSSLRSDLADHVMHHDRWVRSRDVVLPTVIQRSELETASYAAGRAGITEVLEAFTAVANARLDTLDREAEVARDAVHITLTYGSDQ